MDQNTIGLMFGTVYGAVLVANLATGGFIYCLWRIRKNENDWWAIAGVLFIALTAGVVGYAIRYPS